MGCADGVNAWKELGKSSFLLVVFAVWNLPADIRMKPENLILLGMHDGQEGARRSPNIRGGSGPAA